MAEIVVRTDSGREVLALRFRGSGGQKTGLDFGGENWDLIVASLGATLDEENQTRRENVDVITKAAAMSQLPEVRAAARREVARLEKKHEAEWKRGERL